MNVINFWSTDTKWNSLSTCERHRFWASFRVFAIQQCAPRCLLYDAPEGFAVCISAVFVFLASWHLTPTFGPIVAAIRCRKETVESVKCIHIATTVSKDKTPPPSVFQGGFLYSKRAARCVGFVLDNVLRFSLNGCVYVNFRNYSSHRRILRRRRLLPYRVRSLKRWSERNSSERTMPAFFQG